MMRLFQSNVAQPVWLNAFEQLQPTPQITAISPSEEALIGPWRALNDPEAQRQLFKSTSPFPELPSWILRASQTTNSLGILYIHRYAKLDCRTPFLPWLANQIGGKAQSLGLRHYGDRLSAAHIELACSWAQEVSTVLVVFDHIKVIKTDKRHEPTSFVQYGLLSTTPCRLMHFKPQPLGIFPPSSVHSIKPSIIKQVSHA